MPEQDSMTGRIKVCTTQNLFFHLNFMFSVHMFSAMHFLSARVALISERDSEGGSASGGGVFFEIGGRYVAAWGSPYTSTFKISRSTREGRAAWGRPKKQSKIHITRFGPNVRAAGHGRGGIFQVEGHMSGFHIVHLITAMFQ